MKIIKKCNSIIQRNKKKTSYHSIYKIIKLLLNTFWPIVFLFERRNKIDENSNVIISLTSFPARINKVHIVIETLLRQSVMPKEIVLWLAETQFPGKNIPKKLENLKKYGLRIVFCDDLKSHKKYYYALQEYKEGFVITVDDDVFYPENLVESLLKTSKSNPGCVCASLVRRIGLGNDGCLDTYSDWSTDVDCNTNSIYYVAVGIGGVLYPPNLLKRFPIDKDVIFQLCPSADDIWLKAVELNNDVPVAKNAIEIIPLVDILIHNNSELRKQNVNNNQNDTQFKNVIRYFGIRLFDNKEYKKI